VYVAPDLTRESTSSFTQIPAVQYGHWPISAETIGNPGRLENTKQARNQGMLEDFSIGTVMGSKRKESRFSRSYLRKKAEKVTVITVILTLSKPCVSIRGIYVENLENILRWSR